MKKVTGIGGVFFKAKNPQAMYRWYEEHLGINGSPEEGVVFRWKEATAPNEEGLTAWSIFSNDTDYFGSSKTGFMINYRVANLQDLLHSLEAQGVKILGQQDFDYGRFAWIQDLEGNRIELWEPPSTINANPSDETTPTP